MKIILMKHICNILEISEEKLKTLENTDLHKIEGDVNREKILIY
jgi:hypothetical protein